LFFWDSVYTQEFVLEIGLMGVCGFKVLILVESTSQHKGPPPSPEEDAHLSFSNLQLQRSS